MSFDRTQLNAFLADHGSTARIVITGFKGSTPRETGASMLVSSTRTFGTIGGGALELDAIRAARTLLDAGTERRALTHALGPSLGQCCGGSVDILIERFTEKTLPKEGEPFARPILPDAAKPVTITRLLAQARQGEAIAPTATGGWFIEPVSKLQTPVWIWGAGHVGRALVTALADLPFLVTWIDTSPDRFPESLPANTTRLIAANPANAAPHTPPDAHHIILTYSHALDLALCHALLPRPHASVGLIGSATKKARFLKRLHDAGLPQATTAKLVCPIGHRSLGKEPAAIALGTAFRLLESVGTGHKQTEQGDVA